MKKTTSTDPRTELENVPLEMLAIYSNTEALKARVSELDKILIARACSMLNVDSTYPLKIGNALPFCASLIYENHCELQCALAVVEASPQYREACAVIEPILTRCKAQAEAEERHTANVGAASTALRLAQEAAAAKATTAANKDAGVIAARRALQEVELSHAGGMPAFVADEPL